MTPDFNLHLTGDMYVEHQEYLERNADLIGNFFYIAERVRQLARIEAMLDEHALWTQADSQQMPAGVEERVLAVLKLLKMRSVGDE